MVLRTSLSTMALLAAMGLLTACGGSSQHRQNASVSGADTAPIPVRAIHMPSKQEASKARDCLQKEGFRASPAQGKTQHGATGLTRYGYPVTQGEYAFAVHRCTAGAAFPSTRRAGPR